MKTNVSGNQNTGKKVNMYNLKHKSESWLRAAFMAFALGTMPTFTQAQTMVSGNISGTWSPSGNPYIVTDDATVPSGQTLTIQPGVTVMIGSNLTVTVNGVIQAVGTLSQRIMFQAPVSSQYWNSIYIYNPSGISRFVYCDFANAQTAISMRVYGGNQALMTEILNSSFSNCTSHAIYGEGRGFAYCDFSYCGGQWATIQPTIKNCVFDNTGNGCQLMIYGQDGGWSTYGYGYGAPNIIGNIFKNLSGTALLMSVGSYAGSGSATFINNTVVNCRAGILAADPWDARIQNNIFGGTTNAVKISGSLSRTVSCNDFYGNATNFTGLPGTYGQVIFANRNGTPSDILYNIYQSAQFVGLNDFHLQAGSPCIDAGEGSPASFDSCFPPSLGSVTNDIGAYGGPNAGQWLVPASTNIFSVAIARYVGVTINPPTNGHYRLEYATALSGTNNWIQLTNMDLTAPFTFVEPASDKRFYRAVLLQP